MSATTGTAMQALADFKLATGDFHVRSPDVVNLAGLNKYLWHKIYYNTPSKKRIGGGDAIDFLFMLKDGGTFTHSLPAMFRQWKRSDVLKRASVNWRSWFVHKTWVRDEIIKNAKYRYGNDRARFEVLADMDRKLEQVCQTDLARGLEGDLSAVPNFTKMEDSTVVDGDLPLSLFAHVNPDAGGMFGRYINSSGAFANNSAVTAPWTTKQGVDPTQADAEGVITTATATVGGKYESKLTPRKEYYDSVTANDPNNIFAALRSIWRKIQWEGPESLRAWFENTQMNNLRIMASDHALRHIENLILAGQDRFVLGPQDPGVSSPQLYGVPIMWWPAMDTAAIHDSYSSSATPNAKTTELAVTAPSSGNNTYGIGGHVMLVNFNALYPFCHDEMWMYREAIPPHFNVPDVFVEYIEGWHNLLCEDYRQHGWVAPLGDQRG